MKTLHTILITILTLSMSNLFAGNDRDFMPASRESAVLASLALSPVTPKEASFEETIEFAGTSCLIQALAPVTPAEAGFEQDSDQPEPVIRIAPSTPAEADFSDSFIIPSAAATVLAPNPPAFADFD